MDIQRKIVGDLDKVYTNYNADIECKEITAFVKSQGNVHTGRVVNKFYNVELCECAYSFYLIITSGTIGSAKQDVKVEAYSNGVYLKEQYTMWVNKLKKNGFKELDILALDGNTCSQYARNFIEECKLKMSKEEAKEIVSNSSKVLDTNTSTKTPVIDKAVARFVDIIYKEADMMMKDYLDTSKLQGSGSIGVVSKASIETGRNLLSMILVVQNKLAIEKNKEKQAELMNEIAQLSNKYNTVIPRVLKQKGQHAWCLATGDLVVAQFEFLDTLELMIANTLLCDNAVLSAEQRYKTLNTDIKHITDKKIITQVNNKLRSEQMHGHTFKTKLLNVYEINQHNAPAFDDSCGNVVSLFHGTGAANLYGILSTHLKVPARTGGNIHITGRMFGDGVYFGQYSKALQYSTRRFGGSKNKGNSYFLLVCDVALGKIHMETSAKHYSTAPKGCHSVMGVGQDTMYSDCEILGIGDVKDFKLTRSSIQRQIGKSSLVLLHNEFIVYNQARFRIKYVIEVAEV